MCEEDTLDNLEKQVDLLIAERDFYQLMNDKNTDRIIELEKLLVLIHGELNGLGVRDKICREMIATKVYTVNLKDKDNA